MLFAHHRHGLLDTAQFVLSSDLQISTPIEVDPLLYVMPVWSDGFALKVLALRPSTRLKRIAGAVQLV